MLQAQARGSAFLLASGALHLALSWYCSPAEPQAPLRAPHAPRVSPRWLSAMEFEVLASNPVPRAEPVAASSEPGAASSEPPAATRPKRRAPAPSPTPSMAASSAPAADDLVADDAPTDGAARLGASGAPRTLDLSPLAAARTLTAEPGQSSFAVPVDEFDYRDVDRAAEARLADGVEGLSRVGKERIPIEETARGLTTLISRPWEVILRPLRHPRYYVHGAGVDAIIRGDGSVQWRDSSGLHFAGSSTKHEVQGQVPGQELTREPLSGPQAAVRPATTWGLGSHDLFSSKLFGYDPYRSERRRILERTRPLRELLHERWRRVALARAAAHLGVVLTRIEVAIQAGDDTRAHAQLFALWDECSEDEVGAVARQRIEGFVREHCRQGSEHTFAEAELLAFNARRASRQRFAPYAQIEDGGLASDAALSTIDSASTP